MSTTGYPPPDSNFAAPVADGPVSPCLSCRWRDYGRTSCAAFPNGIPRIILDGHNPHTAPFAGDQGITYRVSPYRDTDGPVTATFISTRGGYNGALWVGDDGTIGAFGLNPGDDTWPQYIMDGLSHGYEPADIFAYWLDAAFNAEVPRRYESVEAVRADHESRVANGSG